VNQNSDRAITAGIVIGGLQLAVFFVVCLFIFRLRKKSASMIRAWPWLTLGGYGILNALLATSGRAAFGAEQALSPRYGIFGVCLTVALAYLVPLVVLGRPTRDNQPRPASRKIRVALAALGAVVIGLHALAFPAAVVNMNIFSLNLRHAKVCLKFLDVLPPQPATLANLCPNYSKVKLMADALDRAGVWDYSLHQTRRLADFKTSPPSAGESGVIENSQTAGGNLVLSGWARASAQHAPADCVVFTCEGAGVEPQVCALMDQRQVRTDLVEKYRDKNLLLAGWEKNCPLAELPKGALTVKAWSYDLATESLTLLASEVRLDNR
jgi:hypothetical protein